jgi:thiamine kinase-like enzyme
MDDFKGNMSTITKKGNVIYKSRPDNSETIKRFLQFMASFPLNMPKYLGETAEEIHLSFVDGKSIHDTLDEIPFEKKEMMIKSAAKLLADFHSASEKFVVLESDRFFLSYPGSLDKDVICHNDFAPYNLTFEDFEAVGIIDFETICPAPREWDIAYALYRFILIDTRLQPNYHSLIQLFLAAYGYKKKRDFLPIVIERIESLVQLFEDEISKKNQSFIEMEKNGHKKFYIEEIERLKSIETSYDQI